MINNDNVGALIGAPIVDPDDGKIGTATRVFLDQETGMPSWATVKTGFLGHRESFVPLRGATFDREVIHVDVDKNMIKGAPNVDPEGELTAAEERELYRYYGYDVIGGEPERQAVHDPATNDQPLHGPGPVVPGQRSDDRVVTADAGRSGHDYADRRAEPAHEYPDRRAEPGHEHELSAAATGSSGRRDESLPPRRDDGLSSHRDERPVTSDPVAHDTIGGGNNDDDQGRHVAENPPPTSVTGEMRRLRRYQSPSDSR